MQAVTQRQQVHHQLLVTPAPEASPVICQTLFSMLAVVVVVMVGCLGIWRLLHLVVIVLSSCCCCCRLPKVLASHHLQQQRSIK